MSLFILITGCTTSSDEAEKVESIVHIHDLAFDREQSDYLFVGTHHGLIEIDTDNGMSWQGEQQERHDFMGFTITSDNTFVSSGHPDPESDLEDPLGLMISEDRGESWHTGMLYGEVDFHLIEVNEANPNVIYGFDAYGQQVKRSQNGGESWETATLEGINLNEFELYSIISDPSDGDVVVTGMRDGVYRSEDGGESFTQINSNLTMTSVDDNADGHLIAHGVGEVEGLMISEDMGETWESFGVLPSEDPVLSIAVSPTDENMIAVGTASDSIYLSEDQGTSWSPLVENGDPVDN